MTLRLSCADFWRWSLLRLVGKVGSGHSKIANNSTLKTVLSAKEAEFCILSRWKPFVIVLFYKVGNLGFEYIVKWSFALPPQSYRQLSRSLSTIDHLPVTLFIF